jgi:hypothetical protein
MLGQDLGQSRQRLFGTIFLIPADEHDVLTLAGTVAALDDQPRVSSVKQRAKQ